jgi:hypothetical protein
VGQKISKGKKVMKIKINITEGHGCSGCGGCSVCGPEAMSSKGIHHGEEARMHRTTLATLMADVKVLLSLIEDGDDLPEWLKTKITKAGDYMHSAARYIVGEEARERGQLEEDFISEGLIYHLKNKLPITENVYRHGSDKYFSLIKEVRTLVEMNIYEPTMEEMDFLNENPDLGEWGIYEGERVPLDFPLYENASQQLLDEKRKKKKKKDPPIGKPMKNTGGGKKYKVYVRSKSGRVKKITYGDSKGGLKGNWNNPEARKSFAARHNCADKKDRTKAGYWACRAHKDFGTNVSGRFW